MRGPFTRIGPCACVAADASQQSSTRTATNAFMTVYSPQKISMMRQCRFRAHEKAHVPRSLLRDQLERNIWAAPTRGCGLEQIGGVWANLIQRNPAPSETRSPAREPGFLWQ